MRVSKETFVGAKPVRAPACPLSFWLQIHWWEVGDLEDLRNKRPALGRTAWTVRLKRLLKTQKAQTVAKRKFQNFKKVCKVVYQRKGAHSGL